MERSNQEEWISTGSGKCPWQSSGPQIPKKRRLGPQNGPRSLEPETLSNKCQDGKLFFKPVEQVGGRQYPLGSNSLLGTLGNLVGLKLFFV
jgi:hypothetical protein